MNSRSYGPDLRVRSKQSQRPPAGSIGVSQRAKYGCAFSLGSATPGGGLVVNSIW